MDLTLSILYSHFHIHVNNLSRNRQKNPKFVVGQFMNSDGGNVQEMANYFDELRYVWKEKKIQIFCRVVFTWIINWNLFFMKYTKKNKTKRK